jgi:hypothetical protein
LLAHSPSASCSQENTTPLLLMPHTPAAAALFLSFHLLLSLSLSLSTCYRGDPAAIEFDSQPKE